MNTISINFNAKSGMFLLNPRYTVFIDSKINQVNNEKLL